MNEDEKQDDEAPAVPLPVDGAELVATLDAHRHAVDLEEIADGSGATLGEPNHRAKGPAPIAALWTDPEGCGPDLIALVIEDWPPPEVARGLMNPEMHIGVFAEANESYASNANELFDGAFSLDRESAAALRSQIGVWLDRHGGKGPAHYHALEAEIGELANRALAGTVLEAERAQNPLVSILDDAAEDATAARIRDLDERNEALDGRLFSFEKRLRDFAGAHFGPVPNQDVVLESFSIIENGMAKRDQETLEEKAALCDSIAALEAKLEQAAILQGLSAPWEQLAKDRGAELDALESRLQTVADEAFGPFPLQPGDESLTAIERGIAAERLANAERRVGFLSVITKLEKSRDLARKQLAEARAKASPPPSRGKTKKKGGRS